MPKISELPDGVIPDGTERGAFVQSGATVGLTLNQITSGMISLDGFGGDPTGATDSTAAWNAALASGKSIYVCGHFALQSVAINPITTTNGLLIQGCGKGAASLVNISAATNDFIVVGSNTFGVGVNVTFKNITIQNNGATGGSSVKLKSATNFLMDNVGVICGGLHGLDIGGDGLALGLGHYSNNVIVQNSYFNGPCTGDIIIASGGNWQSIYIGPNNEVTGGSAATDNTIAGIRIVGSGTYLVANNDVYTDNISKIILDNAFYGRVANNGILCNATTAGLDGIQLISAQSNTVVDNWFYCNTGSNIRVIDSVDNYIGGGNMDFTHATITTQYGIRETGTSNHNTYMPVATKGAPVVTFRTLVGANTVRGAQSDLDTFFSVAQTFGLGLASLGQVFNLVENAVSFKALSGTATGVTSYSIGNTAERAVWANTGAVNQWFTGTVQNDIAIKSTGDIWLGRGADLTTTSAAPVVHIGAGTFALPIFGTGLLHSSSAGAITSSAISLTSDITGTLGPANGGTGVANNASSTLTIAGNFGLTFTIAAARDVTLPATGTVAMRDVANTFTADQTFNSTNNISLGGHASPSLLFSPSSGATKITNLSQTADIFSISVVGVGNAILVDLSNRNVSLQVVPNTGTANTLCYNTSTGYITYAVGACVVSVLAAKNLLAPLEPKDGFDLVMAMTPWRYTMKPGPSYVPGEQIGFVADFAVEIDPRVTAFNTDGTISGIRYEQYTAALTAAFQHLKVDNDNLRSRIDVLEGKMAFGV